MKEKEICKKHNLYINNTCGECLYIAEEKQRNKNKYRIEFKFKPLNKPYGFYDNAIYEIEEINKEEVRFKGYNYVFKLTEIIFKEL